MLGLETLKSFLFDRSAQQEIKTINVKSQRFLTLVRQSLDIKSIYYPGCKHDFGSLEGPFKKAKIVYVDHSKNIWNIKQASGRNVLIADAGKRPFKPEVFQAVFIQDLHPNLQTFLGIMSTLKPGGVLIFSSNDCGNIFGIQPMHLQRMRDLQELHFPFRTKYYTVFQKVDRP